MNFNHYYIKQYIISWTHWVLQQRRLMGISHLYVHLYPYLRLVQRYINYGFLLQGISMYTTRIAFMQNIYDTGYFKRPPQTRSHGWSLLTNDNYMVNVIILLFISHFIAFYLQFYTQQQHFNHSSILLWLCQGWEALCQILPKFTSFLWEMFWNAKVLIRLGLYGGW